MTEPTPTELRATLVTLVAGTTGTRCGPWEDLIGDVEVRADGPVGGCNWHVAIHGSEAERTALENAISLLRDEHPRIRSIAPPPGAGAIGA